MITDTELYYYRWDELIAKELKRVVEIMRELHGDKEVIEILNCTNAKLKKRLAPAQALPDVPGEPIVEVPLSDIVAGRTLVDLEIVIGRPLIKAVNGLSSLRDLERFLNFPARGMGRIMDHAE